MATSLPQYVSISRDGVYRVRIPIAPELRDRLPDPYKGKLNLFESLHSKTKSEAIARSHSVIDRLLRMRDAARPVPHKWVYLPPASDETTRMTTAFSDLQQEIRATLAGDKSGIEPGTLAVMESFLQLDSVPMLAGEFRNVPVTEPVAETMPLAGMTFAQMVDYWAEVNSGTAPKEVRAYHRFFARLAKTVGHDDSNRVTPQDIIRHEEGLRREGLAQKTISNHLKGFRVVFRTAKEKLKIDANPMGEIVIREGHGEVRLDFTPAERDRILLAARDATDPVIKWCNLLAGFMGARIEEIAEMDLRDVCEVDGVLVFDIRREHRLEASPNRVLKNFYSVRQVPVHSAIAAEFRAYVESVRRRHGDKGPLFPGLKPDQDGRLSDRAGKLVNPWLRKTCGITDPRKSFHSWRHCIVTALDGMVETQGAMQRKLTGHAPETDSEKYIHKTIAEKAAAIEMLTAPWAK